MNDLQAINWKRIAVEAAAIVVSILLAFAIDAWWDDRRERIEEREVLIGLKSEFSRYRDDLAISIEIQTNVLLSTSDLVVATRRGFWESEVHSFDTALVSLSDPKSHDFGGGVLDALISSGRLEIISDNDLRVKLATWSEVFNEIRDDENRNMAFISDQVYPYMLRWHIPHSRGIEICCSWTKWPLSTRSVTDDPDALSRLLTDPEFETMVELRHTDFSHLALEYENGIREMDEILDAIDESLGR